MTDTAKIYHIMNTFNTSNFGGKKYINGITIYLKDGMGQITICPSKRSFIDIVGLGEKINFTVGKQYASVNFELIKYVSVSIKSSSDKEDIPNIQFLRPQNGELKHWKEYKM